MNRCRESTVRQGDFSVSTWKPQKLSRRQRIGSASSRSRKGALRSDHLVHRAAETAQWIACAGLHLIRPSRVGRGTLPQHRVTKLSPRPAGAEELARLFEEALLVAF